MYESDQSNILPFLCKWSGDHPKQRRFNIQKELELHVRDGHIEDLDKLK